MGKFRDKSSAGRSALVPYIAGESSSARHSRRLEVNLDAQGIAVQVCADLGVKLSIHNDGQHWMFTYGPKRFEWWPSSAKFVVNKQWRKGVHVHDFEKAISLIKTEIKKGTNDTSNR